MNKIDKRMTTCMTEDALLVGVHTHAASMEICVVVFHEAGYIMKMYFKIQQYHSWAYTQRTLHLTHLLSQAMFIIDLLIIPRNWSQSRCLSTDEWTKKM